MTDDKKVILQQVIDNLLYIEGYKDKLIEFNKQFNNPMKIKYITETDNFLLENDDKQ